MESIVFSWEQIRGHRIPDTAEFIRAKRMLAEALADMLEKRGIEGARFVGPIAYSEFDLNFRSEIEILIVPTPGTEYEQIERLKAEVLKQEAVVVNDVLIDPRNPGNVDRISHRLYGNYPKEGNFIGRDPLEVWVDVDRDKDEISILAKDFDNRLNVLKNSYPDLVFGEEYYSHLSMIFDTSRIIARRVAVGLTNQLPDIHEEIPGAKAFRSRFLEQPKILDPFERLVKLDNEYWFLLGEAMTGELKTREQYESWLLENGKKGHELATDLVSELTQEFPLLGPEGNVRTELLLPNHILRERG